ncbi:MAG: DUF3106 domain-containing protein [Verrucomicrobiia bacterium]
MVAIAAGQLAVFQLAAETVAPVPAPQKLFSGPTNLSLPPLPRLKSPVDLFRELLAMTPADRENYLTNRPPETRARILAKVREYEALDPDERELRLRATELRWYLLPLLRESPTNRTAQLAAIPDDLQPLVKNRLRQWDILPPTLRAEFLASERTLRYFTHVDPSHSPPLPPLPPGHGLQHGPHDSDSARWNMLSEDQRQKIAAQCSQFFELTPVEKKKTLSTLSDAERQQMEKTLATFGKLPPAQRQKCIRAFTEFAGMSAEEKRDFLKNAQRWSQLSPKERQTWRDLVTHVPEWQPLPSALIMPPMPPTFHPALVTNHG